MRQRRSIFSSITSLLLLAGVLAGCASTAPAPSPAERAAVVGVWEYRTSGSPYLGQGTLHIRIRNGRLRAQLRDTQRGRMDAQVNQRGSRIELALDHIRVSGRVENDKLVGLFRRPTWDVSTSQDVRSTRSRRYGSDSGSIVARRVQNPGVVGAVPTLGCTPILVEVDSRCQRR